MINLIYLNDDHLLILIVKLRSGYLVAVLYIARGLTIQPLTCQTETIVGIEVVGFVSRHVWQVPRHLRKQSPYQPDCLILKLNLIKTYISICGQFEFYSESVLFEISILSYCKGSQAFWESKILDIF